jgi:hypothetical protein
VSDGTRLREEFLLDPSVTFLNHGSFGASPRAVFETYQEWQPGDEVLSTDLEYGALDLMWEHVCGDFGASYVRTPIRLPVTSAEEIVDAIWAGVGPRTLGRWSAASSLSASFSPSALHWWRLDAGVRERSRRL